jgi:lambda family phage portal protein
LAPVIEALKQLDRYSEAELMAAVVSSFFTVFVKSDNGEGLGDLEGAPAGPGGDMNLGPGAIVDLGPNEDVTFANPSRPSAQFDPFWLAMVRQIGVALEIPYEVLIKHFSSSYTASRAALEVAWQHFKARRAWLASSFCQPVWDWFVAEAVARGLLAAPGFDDPVRRAAWCSAIWVGDGRISLDPLKENKGDEIAEAHGWKTAEQITAERTGGDWRRNMQARAREVAIRREAGLDPVPATPGVASPGGGAPSPEREETEE